MNLRKTLAVAAAALAVGAFGFAGTTTSATASTPTGDDVEYIRVNGSSTPNGNVGIEGIFKGGTATFAGNQYGCTGGSADGTVRRGTIVAGAEMTFTSLSIVCSTPAGNATISLTCPINLNFDPTTGATNVHDGLVDSGAPPAKFHRVPGTVRFPTVAQGGYCVRASVVGGLCTFNITGDLPAYFDEAVKTGGDQTLGLTGVGSIANPSFGCFGQVTGDFELNDIEFWIDTDAGGDIDFRLTP
jgi:hypothetical protein